MKEKLIEPMVSVLTTSYNRSSFIAAALESVLSSSYRNFELIVVDDCSTDSTVAVAKKIAASDERVRIYINDSNQGDYPNRNIAASYAKGKYIKYLDSDDIMYPHCLEVMVNAMEKFPGAGYGLSAAGYEEQPMPLMKDPRQTYLEHFGTKKHFDRAPGSAIILKEAFDKIGGFSGKRMIGDFELWLKMSCHFPLVVFQRDIVWDRTHSGQERQSDYAKEYDRLRSAVLTDALEKAECPLSKEEIDEIKRRIKREKLKKYIKKIV
jgi:glycosyltransferase involved in cell wall biosynthesis